MKTELARLEDDLKDQDAATRAQKDLTDRLGLQLLRVSALASMSLRVDGRKGWLFTSHLARYARGVQCSLHPLGANTSKERTGLSLPGSARSTGQ
eukprot:2483386-Amphidinium_carterae.2